MSSFYHLALAVAFAFLSSKAGLAQTQFTQPADQVSTEDLPTGFSKVSGKRVDVITDMPLSDDLRELTGVFDAAFPQWCQVLELPAATVSDWHAEAFMMLERERFKATGLLPEALSAFRYGFQYGDRLWVTEQPSAYYRRHLLLHEGTHWMMTRKFGRQGPPWLMEGMAEWFATHTWDGRRLSMGVVPRTRDEVPYWGRTKIIQQQLTDGVAPSLETILRYGATAHQEQEAYAWSWAAVLFLKHHPDTADTFATLLRQPMMGRDTANRWLFSQLQAQWPRLRGEWNALLADLDYGFDVSRGLLTLTPAPQPLQTEIMLTIDTSKSWQASGVVVTAGSTIRVSAAGEFMVGQLPKPWPCTADGVTLEYYRGVPLGRLLMTIVSPVAQEPDFSRPISVMAIGSGDEVQLTESGELHFRINESSDGMADNLGTLTVTIRP